jgi:hypothetical protein
VNEPRVGAVLDDIAIESGLTKGTLADTIGVAMCRRVVSGDVGAAKELCDGTEGRVPASVSVEASIDDAAGRSAKEQLLEKLGSIGR